MKRITFILFILMGIAGFGQKTPFETKLSQKLKLKEDGSPVSSNLYSGKSLLQLTQDIVPCDDLDNLDLNAEILKRHLVNADLYNFVEKPFWGRKTPYEFELTQNDMEIILKKKTCYVIFNPTDDQTTEDLKDNITFSDTFDPLHSCYPVKMFQPLKAKSSYVALSKGKKILYRKPGDYTTGEIHTVVTLRVLYTDDPSTYQLYDIVEDPTTTHTN